MTMDENEAAAKLQGLWRIRKARKAIREVINKKIEKIYDPKTGAFYYYNRETSSSSWVKPKLLGSEDISHVAQTYTDEQAAYKIQQLWRSRNARKYLRQMIRSMVDKVWDENYQAYYYFNTKTGEVSWEKPLVLGSHDIDEEESAPVLPKGFFGEEDGEGGDGEEDDEEEEEEEDTVWEEVEGEDGEMVTQKVARKPKTRWEELADEIGSMAGSDDGSSVGDKAKERKFPRSKSQALVDAAEDTPPPGAVELNISDMGCERVTSRVWGLTSLQRLVVKGNKLSKVSAGIGGLRALNLLDASHNALTRVAVEVERLTGLTRLDLSHNRLRKYPANLYKLKNIRSLELQHNRMSLLPLEVGNLQLLKETAEWEVGVGMLKELRALDVSHNKLKQFPLQLELCTNLQVLRLDHNRVCNGCVTAV